MTQLTSRYGESLHNIVHPSEFVFQKSQAIASDFWGIQTHYFFHNVFFYENFTKTSEITLKSSETTVRSQKSQLSVEEILILIQCDSLSHSSWFLWVGPPMVLLLIETSHSIYHKASLDKWATDTAKTFGLLPDRKGNLAWFADIKHDYTQEFYRSYSSFISKYARTG